MIGTLTTLEHCLPGDYERLAKWFSSASGWYALGKQKLFSADDLRNENLHGKTHFLIVVENGSKRRVGAVTWTEKEEYEGSYVIGTGVGDPELYDRGLGAEASVLLLNYLFHMKNAHRVEFLFGLYNKHALPALTQWNVTLEGILRDYFYLDGEYQDAALCSVLRDEFYEFAAAGGFLSTLDEIPRADKEEARALVSEHLAKMPDRHLADLFGRPRPVAPHRRERPL
ncbi:GNAT family N-acetyltransferase [Actinomadura montaniterrae]|uniref:GNAT family N-acetyltransferase n=1 Tax=Actinomadura montaniterrae TaxID=1803903 RepID=A0A6L3W9V2_9ACTN|nr:GNAT family protein [Actinomadura montaniterrae]KAB2390331.1 GNAT family N-acetyltransferase [Actinomadura montaniterrae]